MVNPEIGLIIWMLIAFSILLIILKKFAWRPILDGLKERESNISNSLAQAKQTQEEMKKLQASNELLLQEAKEQRDEILKEARKIKDNIISEAKNTAQLEADKVVESARANIENEKKAAITELKNQIADISIEVAENILKRELSDKQKQKELIEDQIKSLNFN